VRGARKESKGGVESEAHRATGVEGSIDLNNNGEEADRVIRSLLEDTSHRVVRIMRLLGATATMPTQGFLGSLADASSIVLLVTCE